MSVEHDGKFLIEDHVYIGSNSCIDEGFSYRMTKIGKHTKIDNLVHVVHGVHIKENSFIIAGTVLGGSSTIANNVWLSINTSIATGLTIDDDAFVSIGSVSN